MTIWEGKKYKLDKSENFEEYMKELGESQTDQNWLISLIYVNLCVH